MPNKNCPICRASFASEQGLESHVDKKHHEQLGGLSPAQYVFNMRNGKTQGLCIMRGKAPGCLKVVEFNEKARRYNRLCRNPGCKEAYVAEFRKRMLEKYGKVHLLDDPEVQRLMLSRRSISDRYAFRDGTEFVYTGEYEREFLEYMDLALEWPSEDLAGPAPFVLPYEHEGEQTYYIPDFYVPSIDLIVEVKGTNAHYQEREKGKELSKDNAARRSGHNFIKIVDRDYDELLEGLVEGRWRIPQQKERQVTVNEDVLASCDVAAILGAMSDGEAEILNESSPEEGYANI